MSGCCGNFYYTAGLVTRTTLDGFGRPIKVETGSLVLAGPIGSGIITFSNIVSQVDSVYAPCGCSPLGKLAQVSRPHAPGAAVYWTIYTYDGIGRTKSVQAPDGASTSGYVYSGATVKTTDPAGKWKLFTSDAAGNLIQVNEPNPAGGADYVTTYTYDMVNRLRTVAMPRPTGTQSRSFTYTGALLTSATNPENGTVYNYYNPDNTLNYKIDAKGQKIAFGYDSYKRVTSICFAFPILSSRRAAFKLDLRKVLVLTFSRYHKYSDRGNAIMIPVTLALMNNSVELDAKLDTGAENCIFERTYADALGLSLEQERSVLFSERQQVRSQHMLTGLLSGP